MIVQINDKIRILSIGLSTYIRLNLWSMSKIRVGIFFGGSSREREVSFAGGRTVYDNLDKSLFEPVPLFIDSFGGIVKLNWEHVYKGSIRDFYPPAAFLPTLDHGFQIYAESLIPEEALSRAGIEINDETADLQALMQEHMNRQIGEPLQWENLKYHIDIAFLALHGTFGEDGSIQGILEWLGIPYTGSGILPSALGINKWIQKKFQQTQNLYINEFESISFEEWMESDTVEKHQRFQYFLQKFKHQFVVKPANQGSSLGVSILEDPVFERFCDAIDLAFFKLRIDTDEFQQKDITAQISYIKELTDIRSGLGLPLKNGSETYYTPDAVMELLLDSKGIIELQAHDSESRVLIESKITGKEFSCIVIEHHRGQPIALPPTEIKKSGALFDYRSKYLPGLSRKETPMDVSTEIIHEIRSACSELYRFFGFEVYARIDGFVQNDGQIFLNDPNTTSGMMPSSFFFHQAAEIGLNPSQFLTFIVRQSLKTRILSHPSGRKFTALKERLDSLFSQSQLPQSAKRKIAVIMGGYSFERHISMESGRNIYEKLSSSEEFEPIPLFLVGNRDAYELYTLPLAYMLKDNADDIRNKILNPQNHDALAQIREETSYIRDKYHPNGGEFNAEKWTLMDLKKQVEGVFIALHGRPGEDGTLQRDLQAYDLYFNGSPSHSSALTIDKYATNQKLREAGFLVADQLLWEASDFYINPKLRSVEIAERFGLPLIAKPADDGCSAAVRKIKSASELEDFARLIFRTTPDLDPEIADRLNINIYDELPQKSSLLIEKFIEKGDALHFLEVTGGMLTHYQEDGSLYYEMFEPSESLAESEILSLEEKFLAGEGQNLTPARFSKDIIAQERISEIVRNTLKRVAETLHVQGYCRIDAFVKIFPQERVEVYIIEINSLPGMTPATCIYHQAALNAYKPFDFIREILNFGRDKWQLETQKAKHS